MYRGFNLKLDANTDFSSWISKGSQMHQSNKAQVEKRLKSFTDDKGNLLASRIIASWFPAVKTNVFLSHSHRDAEQAIGLSGWLFENLGLTSFIDSCVWGYSDELLRVIDNEYCLNRSRGSYSYEKRNRSTSHVHMMLSTALAKMIHDTECIIFVDTPNSISPKAYIEGEDTTHSPWIYSEIAMTGLVQKRQPREHRRVRADALDEGLRPLNINYPVDVGHLTPITVSDLVKWKDCGVNGEESLDVLYNLKK